jgi:hypothetical protein
MSEELLGQLAARVNDNHWKYHNAVRAALPYARAAGEALIEAKRVLNETRGHGHWLDWLKHNFDAKSEDTAQKYMRVAREWDHIEKQLDDNPTLGIEEAVAGTRENRDPEDDDAAADAALYEGTATVKIQPAKKARRELEKWFRDKFRDAPNDTVIFLVRHCLRDLERWLRDYAASVKGVAKAVTPAELRRDWAMKKYCVGPFAVPEDDGNVVDEDGDGESQGPTHAEINADCRAEIVEKLQDVEAIPEQHRATVAWLLGFRLNDVKKRGQIRGKLKESARPHDLDPHWRGHVASLLIPPDPAEEEAA